MNKRIILALLLLSGCAQVHTEEEWARLLELSHTPESLVWIQSQEDRALVDGLINTELQTPLERESAVRIALLNNSHLQAMFESIGVSKSDLIQAGLFTNPKVSALFRFPSIGGTTHVEMESSIIPIADIWLIPQRKKVAKANLEKTLLEVANQVRHTRLHTLQAYSDLYFTQKIYDLGLKYLKLFQAMEMEAINRKKFGYMIDSDIYMTQILVKETEILVDEYRVKLNHAKSKLAHLMGLQENKWDLSTKSLDTPQIPLELTPALENAYNHRLDLRAARIKVCEAESNVDLNEFMFLKDIHAGLAYERESRHHHALGPVMDAEIPLFDQNQAQISKAGFLWRQAKKKARALEEDIRLHIQELQETITHLQFKVDTFKSEVIPLRQKTSQFVKHWTGLMQINRFVYLQTHKEQMKANLDYLMAQKELFHALQALEYEMGQ